MTDTILQLSPLEANRRIFWHVSAVNEQGASAYSEAASFQTGDQITSVEDYGGSLVKYTLSQNYPNPFNFETKICFEIKTKSKVIIKIYDILGRDIFTLCNEFKQAGSHEIKWNAENFSTGIYFYKMEVAGINGRHFSEMKKCVLMK